MITLEGLFWAYQYQTPFKEVIFKNDLFFHFTVSYALYFIREEPGGKEECMLKNIIH